VQNQHCLFSHNKELKSTKKGPTGTFFLKKEFSLYIYPMPLVEHERVIHDARGESRKDRDMKPANFRR
jgi:hypothetical protein